MKTREGGMPEEQTWETFSQPKKVLSRLGLKPQVRQVVDFGCGYGTFSLAAARLTTGQVPGLDTEPEMEPRPLPSPWPVDGNPPAPLELPLLDERSRISRRSRCHRPAALPLRPDRRAGHVFPTQPLMKFNRII